MKPRTIIIPAVLVLAGAAGLALYLRGHHRATPAAAPSVAAVAGAADGGAPTPTPLPLRRAPLAGTAGSGAAPAAETDGAPVTVGRDQTVATVNGVAITGGDLLAFKAKDGDHQQLTGEMHEFLTQRAIQRELTLQAARARKLELTATDAERLEQVKKNAEQSGETDPAQLAFEDEEARAQILLGALVAADGGPAQLAGDADVDKYLADHAAELGPMPTDPALAQQRRIDIRQKLYGEFAARYEERTRALLERLESEATITRP